MNNLVIVITKFVMFFMNISRGSKGKLGDETETEIMKAVEDMINDLFGG